MTDGSEKRNRQLAFELQNSHVCEKRSKARCISYSSPRSMCFLWGIFVFAKVHCSINYRVFRYCFAYYERFADLYEINIVVKT